MQKLLPNRLAGRWHIVGPLHDLRRHRSEKSNYTQIGVSDAKSIPTEWTDDDYNWIRGHRGDDIISGRALADWLLGGRGFDQVDGGLGNDSCRGEVLVSCNP